MAGAGPVIKTILVANRGEIAVRVIETAAKLGYKTVAVYSEADKNSRFVQLADQAICIGPAPVNQSYLCADKIIAAAKTTGADAIHPGYGFLSENAEFAQLCQKENIIFIGPSAEAIELMGNKRQAKIAMEAAGVPCIPGYQGADQSDSVLVAEINKIGFPVMIKAAAGGGGRGMRLVDENSDLMVEIQSARSEAENAFGSGELILEKAIINPRHIEIQVFADQHDNFVYLWERDCSVQRRHQKVIEEAPSPVVNEALRKAMGEAALLAAKSCNYEGAGTVEFLLAADGDFYFLEMNTRLQVEHPVTELICQQDLVAWQISVANGEKLPLTQDQIPLEGHAIEVRLYAEDPYNNFLPQTGKVLRWLPSPHIRTDHTITNNMQVSAHYDPMLAKLIAYGATRGDAVRKLARALEDTTLLGFKTNQHYLYQLLTHQEFAAGEATTSFIADHQTEFEQQTEDLFKACVVVAALSALTSAQANQTPSAPNPHFLGMQTGVGFPLPHNWQIDESKWQTAISNIRQQANTLSATISVTTTDGQEQSHQALLTWQDHPSSGQLKLDETTTPYQIATSQTHRYVQTGSFSCCVESLTLTEKSGQGQSGSGILKAPMDGAIVNLLVEEGATVLQGQTILLLEAMKMEHQVKADLDGQIKKIHVSPGEQVKGRQLLVEVSASE